MKLQEKSLSIDEYEQTRPPRRGRTHFLMPKDVRHEILTKDWDYSFKSLREAIVDVSKERESRLKSQRQVAGMMKIQGNLNNLMTKVLCRRNSV